MLRKRTLIKNIQKKLKIKSFASAEKTYNILIEELQNGLREEGAIKLEGIGIIKVTEKASRLVKVPTREEKVVVPKRVGLTFKEDGSYKQG